jgi:hypothetical protein
LQGLIEKLFGDMGTLIKYHHHHQSYGKQLAVTFRANKFNCISHFYLFNSKYKKLMKEYENVRLLNEIHIQNKIQVQPIDNSLNRLILKLGKETQTNHHS